MNDEYRLVCPLFGDRSHSEKEIKDHIQTEEGIDGDTLEELKRNARKEYNDRVNHNNGY